MKHIQQSIILLCIFIASGLTAQERPNEVKQVISSKAAKGYLFDYAVNETDNKIELTYMLKDTPKKSLIETYSFKYDDLSFIGSTEEELEKEKIKTKYKWFSSAEPTRLLKITTNIISGKLKLHKGYIEDRGYAGRAHFTAFIEEQTVDVSTSQGDKFLYLAHRTEAGQVTGTMAWGHVSIGEGNVVMIGMEKTKPYYSKYGLTIYDAKTLSETFYSSFDLGHSYVPMSVSDLPNGDFGIVFQPMAERMIPKTKGAREKFDLDPKEQFQYIQINTKGEIVSRASFDVETTQKGGLYNFSIRPTNNPNEVVLIGVGQPNGFMPPANINPKFLAPSNRNSGAIDIRVKPDVLVAVRINSDGVVFQKQMPVTDLLTKLSLTPETSAPGDIQKHIKAGGMTIEDAHVDKEDNLLVGLKCRGLHHTMQFSPSGDLMTNYYDETDQDWCITNEYVRNSKDEVYWVTYDMPKYKGDASSEDKQNAYNQRTAVVSKLDPTTGKVVTSVSLTPSGVSLDPVEAVKYISQDEMLILGNGRKKEISLSRLILN